MPRRMADYFLRIQKKFPTKQIKQVVIYLRSSNSPLVRQTQFQSQGMTHCFEVVRLWEQPRSLFWDMPGLLPLAILSQAGDVDAVATLQEIQNRIEEIVPDGGMQSNLAAATAILAGLKLESDVIQQVMRSRTMRESTFYQAILEEGRQEGLQEGRQQERFRLLRKIVPLLQSWGVPIAPILNLAGVTLAELEGQEEDDSETEDELNL